MATSFENKKALRFVITLGTGKFGSSNNDQIILQGFRASVDIDKAGGVNARLLFNPAIQFGGRVKIETDVMQAAGEWVVACISHHLESEKPGGAWFSTIRCNQIGLAITGR